MEYPLIQYITHDSNGHSHAENAEKACKAGVKWIQFRMKKHAVEDFEKQAQEVKDVCVKYGAVFCVNDQVNIAKQLQAQAIHLGMDDMPQDKARAIVGANIILGGTANTFEHIQELVRRKVDYIGLGPFAFTTTKDKLSPILGIEGYKTILLQCKQHGFTTPIYAIGGIKLKDIPLLMQLDIHGVALSSLITNAEDPKDIVSFISNFKKVV